MSTFSQIKNSGLLTYYHNNILANQEELVAETKKVTDFMNGNSDPSLAAGKTVVNKDMHNSPTLKHVNNTFAPWLRQPRLQLVMDFILEDVTSPW